MAKVLLVDTNFSSGPIYSELLARGHEVHVVGGNPADCLAKSASHYWHQDYSDIDALSALVDEQGFDYLVPGCTDQSYASCAAVSRGRFPGFDSAVITATLNHKARFRKVAGQLGLPVPRVHEDISSCGDGPVIIKPVDAFSGMGITVLHEVEPVAYEQAARIARAASSSGECLVEDFVEGQLYSHSAFLRGQHVVRDFLVQEDGTANPLVVDTSRVVDDENGLLARLRWCVEKLAGALDLFDGLLHTQFISNAEDVWLIEVTRRCPGDLYSQLVELATGFPYAQSYACAFLGQDSLGVDTGQTRPLMRHTITVQQGQTLAHVGFHRALTIERLVPLSLVGDQLKPSPKSRVAIIFCSERDGEKLGDLYRATLNRDLYSVSSGHA